MTKTDADAIRVRAEFLAAAAKASAERKRAVLKKAERLKTKARLILKSLCWDCWRSGQNILTCECGKPSLITDFCSRLVDGKP